MLFVEHCSKRILAVTNLKITDELDTIDRGRLTTQDMDLYTKGKKAGPTL